MIEAMTEYAYKNAYQCMDAFISSKPELTLLSDTGKTLYLGHTKNFKPLTTV